MRNMLQPTMGMKKLEVFDTNLKGRSKWKSVKMSCTKLAPELVFCSMQWPLVRKLLEDDAHQKALVIGHIYSWRISRREVLLPFNLMVAPRGIRSSLDHQGSCSRSANSEHPHDRNTPLSQHHRDWLWTHHTWTL